ncbi:primosomal protein DnaI [Evansella caseinilytica]|uniref:Primosomal protein DnaI n=1 Tax=Evansella caseinilytica TaxID=1503961 RepID=A0A1H3TVB5_9BACI|nr:primosomal protein DnaI [Evansella caseinilytica]SDZ54173.1 primosomal protein DnaI [Evansella caseinilytica]
MDSIGKTINHFLNGGFEERYRQLTESVLENQRIRSYLAKHPYITERQVERGINELYQYKTQWDNCDACPGLSKCPNIVQGYQPRLTVYRGDFQLEYHMCTHKKKAEEQRRQAALIQSFYIPKEIMNATFDDFYEDHPSRTMIAAKALEFILHVNPGENGRGLYIHGPFGVGKTFLTGAIANELADRNIQTMIVYSPDFFRELKNGIHDGSYQQKLEQVKRAPVLILDDIGAETMSNWVRDDILGALLQFRMMEKLPTLFTSNFDLDELEHHLTYTQRGGLEKMDQLKAKRIMERVRHMNEVVDMKGENRRK